MLSAEQAINPDHFAGSYDPKDVQILLKPVDIAPTPVEQKELLIQSGARHYSEMLSPERVPDDRYMRLYEDALERNASRLRMDIHHLAQRIIDRPDTSTECVIVSLARAGTPIGVLLKREIERQGVIAHHYSVSIIRGRGIDENAMRFIKDRHGVDTTVFVDGWTGKGAITQQLVESLDASSLGFKPFLAVVADPAGRAHLAATTQDYVIPSGLLNGIVSGLISRSILNDDLVGPADFHACKFMNEFAPHDISRAFIERIETAPAITHIEADWSHQTADAAKDSCEKMLAEIMRDDNVTDVNRIKPGIAEATRAILRRVPDKLYLSDLSDPEVQHMVHIATQAGVPIEQRELYTYRAVTIIKKVGGEQE